MFMSLLEICFPWFCLFISASPQLMVHVVFLETDLVLGSCSKQVNTPNSPCNGLILALFSCLKNGVTSPMGKGWQTCGPRVLHKNFLMPHFATTYTILFKDVLVLAICKWTTFSTFHWLGFLGTDCGFQALDIHCKPFVTLLVIPLRSFIMQGYLITNVLLTVNWISWLSQANTLNFTNTLEMFISISKVRKFCEFRPFYVLAVNDAVLLNPG